MSEYFDRYYYKLHLDADATDISRNELNRFVYLAQKLVYETIEACDVVIDSYVDAKGKRVDIKEHLEKEDNIYLKFIYPPNFYEDWHEDNKNSKEWIKINMGALDYHDIEIHKADYNDSADYSFLTDYFIDAFLLKVSSIFSTLIFRAEFEIQFFSKNDKGQIIGWFSDFLVAVVKNGKYVEKNYSIDKLHEIKKTDKNVSAKFF